MSKEGLENRTGALDEVYLLFKEGTHRTAAELTNDRYKDASLRDEHFYTANFFTRTIENGEDILYVGGRDANPILNNIKNAAYQLYRTADYITTEQEMQDIRGSVESGSTVRVMCSQLRLKKDRHRYACLKASTRNYREELNREEKMVVEAMVGSDAKKSDGEPSDLEKSMRMFSDAGIGEIEIEFLSPEYVMDNETVRKGGAISHGCGLEDFCKKSKFNLEDRGVNSVSTCMRGIPKEMSGSEAKENEADKIERSYETIFYALQESRGKMTSDTATEVSRLVTDRIGSLHQEW